MCVDAQRIEVVFSSIINVTIPELNKNTGFTAEELSHLSSLFLVFFVGMMSGSWRSGRAFAYPTECRS